MQHPPPAWKAVCPSAAFATKEPGPRFECIFWATAFLVAGYYVLLCFVSFFSRKIGLSPIIHNAEGQRRTSQ
jgi:hypothetical protein